MARRLGSSGAEFRRRYARRIHGQWSLVERLTSHGYDCVFLDRDTVPGKAVCGIYDARPKQCRTWPFWPENLESRAAWDDVRRATPCPGMGHGRLVRIDEIRISRDG